MTASGQGATVASKHGPNKLRTVYRNHRLVRKFELELWAHKKTYDGVDIRFVCRACHPCCYLHRLTPHDVRWAYAGGGGAMLQKSRDCQGKDPET